MSPENDSLIILFVIGGVIVILSMLSGWRRGPVRQVFAIVAILAAYFAGFIGSGALLSVVQPLFDLPGLLLRILLGLLLGLVVYIGVNGIASILFKATKDQESSALKFLYGIGGMLVGAVQGLLFVWLLLMSVRVLGSVAESRIEGEREAVEAKAIQEAQEPNRVSLQLARMKKQLEDGATGEIVKTVDIVPEQVYTTLNQLGRVVSNPAAMDRFHQYPQAQELMQHPKLTALLEDPDIAEEINQGNYLGLLQNQKLIDASNDPELGALLKKFPLEKALEHSLQKSAE